MTTIAAAWEVESQKTPQRPCAHNGDDRGLGGQQAKHPRSTPEGALGKTKYNTARAAPERVWRGGNTAPCALEGAWGGHHASTIVESHSPHRHGGGNIHTTRRDGRVPISATGGAWERHQLKQPRGAPQGA